MSNKLWQFGGVVAMCLLALGLTGAARAQEKKPNTAPLDRAELDKRINEILINVTNAGAALYNPPVGDRAGCYRLYECALLVLKPLLDHRPALQEAIDEAHKKANGQRDPGDRAWTLREVMDRIRAEVKGKKPPDKKPTDKKSTLWQRLGGEQNVRRVVDNFVELAAENPKVDFTRGGKYKFTEKQLGDLKQKLVEMISMASGGPLKYTGKGMLEVHKGMGITDTQFEALAADLKKALDKNDVQPADRDAVLSVVELTRKAIVEKKGGKDDKQEEETATVSGHVTYKGKPLPSGMVSFHSKANKTKNAAIEVDGTYQAKLAPGDYRVTVAVAADKQGKKPVNLPEKYADSKTSGLKYTAVKGKQDVDIELK
jgi:hemoglobin